MHVCTYARMHVFTYAHMYVFTYAYMHACMIFSLLTVSYVFLPFQVPNFDEVAAYTVGMPIGVHFDSAYPTLSMHEYAYMYIPKCMYVCTCLYVCVCMYVHKTQK